MELNKYDGQPTDALIKKWAMNNSIKTLETFSPETCRLVLDYVRKSYPKDTATFDAAVNSAWVPARYMTSIASRALVLLGEERFSAYWVKTALSHFDSGPLAHTFKVFGKLLGTRQFMSVLGWGFGIVTKNNGVLGVQAGEDGQSVVVSLSAIPTELLMPAHFIGLSAVWRAVLVKAGAKNVTVQRTETANTYTYRCAWGTR